MLSWVIAEAAFEDCWPGNILLSGQISQLSLQPRAPGDTSVSSVLLTFWKPWQTQTQPRMRRQRSSSSVSLSLFSIFPWSLISLFFVSNPANPVARAWWCQLGTYDRCEWKGQSFCCILKFSTVLSGVWEQKLITNQYTGQTMPHIH